MSYRTVVRYRTMAGLHESLRTMHGFKLDYKKSKPFALKIGEGLNASKVYSVTPEPDPGLGAPPVTEGGMAKLRYAGGFNFSDTCSYTAHPSDSNSCLARGDTVPATQSSRRTIRGRLGTWAVRACATNATREVQNS